MALLSDRQELIDLRNSLGLTQAQMAEILEVPFRTYQARESGPNDVRPEHLKAARYAAMEYVVGRSHHSFAAMLPRDIREMAGSVAILSNEAEAAVWKPKRKA